LDSMLAKMMLVQCKYYELAMKCSRIIIRDEYVKATF
jgi:hypothetical protein